VWIGIGEWKGVAQVDGTGPPLVGASALVVAVAIPVKRRSVLVAGSISGLAGVSTLATAAPGLVVGLVDGLEGASSRVVAAVAVLCAGALPGAPVAGALRGGRVLFVPEEARQAGRHLHSSRLIPRNQGKLQERLIFPLWQRRYAEMLLNSLVLRL
jgi:hypothetical protein